MKYSFNWLKELSKTKKTPEKLATFVSSRAFEFEEMQKISGLENIVVGKIESIKKHPNADRLQLAKINIGGKKLDIVCGAPNIKTGDLVPVATCGAVLGKDFVIKETEIRGVKSQGMLCSKKELGIGDDHDGIFILDKKAKIGQDFSKHLEMDDTQIEFSILPNRGHDALSHIGMAREICAIEGRKFSEKKYSLKKENTKVNLKIDIKSKQLCSRYIGALIENVEVGASPVWIQARLVACGLKPINNIVDVTNYIMLETGQPLHAFDVAKLEIRNSKLEIIIRKAKKGEKLKLLDEKEYILNENDIVIADPEKAIALAGVMGGFDSAINDNTTSIIFESANFNSTSVRKTRTAHNISTDASFRFEREIDPNLAELAMARALELIKKEGGKKVEIKAITDVYPQKAKPWKIKLDTDYVKKLLGENIPLSKMKSILENLGLKPLGSLASKFLQVEIPTHRIDLKGQEDLIEEIGRIYGYENIKEQPLAATIVTPHQNNRINFERKLRDVLVGLEFSEVMNYSFCGNEDILNVGLDSKDHIEIENPLSPDQKYLRTTLVFGILKNVRKNSKYFEKFSIFEIGHIYSSDNEKEIIGGAFVNPENKKNLFFEAKGKIETLFSVLGAKEIKFEKPKMTGIFVHPTRTAVIKSKDVIVGYLGEASPLVLGKFGIKQSAAIFELDIQKLINICETSKKTYSVISKFPSVKRDISMFVGKNVLYVDIEKEIEKSGGELVLGIELFDIFEKEEERSLAVRVEIGSSKKTLTSEEIDVLMKKIIDSLERNLKVKVRK